MQRQRPSPQPSPRRPPLLALRFGALPSRFPRASPFSLHLNALFGGVRNMNEGDRRLAVIAEAQFGAFARHQAAKEGLSEYAQTRRVMAGRWETMYPGVYRFPGTTPTGRPNPIAAALWGGAASA